MAELEIAIVTVEREFWSGKAEMIVAKTTEGEIGTGPRRFDLIADRSAPSGDLIGPDMRRAPHRAPKHHHHITFTIEELDHE
mgnify:CR=1 FL=1